MPNRIRRGFTIVELLVVIGIITVLVALLLPALNKVRQAAVAVQCMSNLRQTGMGVIQYSLDYKGWMIATEGLITGDPLVPTYSTAYLRYSRSWPIVLMYGRYIPDIAVKKGLVNENWEVKFPNVFSCPAQSLEGMNYLGSSGQRIDNNSNLTSYGMRVYPHNFTKDDWSDLHGKQWQSNAIDGAGKDFFGQTAKINKINKNVPFLADSTYWRGSATPPEPLSRQANTFFMRTYSPDGLDGNPHIDRRHSRKANCWYPDGRVEAKGKQELLEDAARNGSPYGYSYP